MDAVNIVGSLALLAAAIAFALVIESGRRHRRATRKAEERRRRQQQQAKLHAADPEQGARPAEPGEAEGPP